MFLLEISIVLGNYIKILGSSYTDNKNISSKNSNEVIEVKENYLFHATHNKIGYRRPLKEYFIEL